MEKDLEELGSTPAQVLHLVGYQQSMLDGKTDLLKEACPTQACPFCDKEEETIQHILVGCVFTRQV